MAIGRSLNFAGNRPNYQWVSLGVFWGHCGDPLGFSSLSANLLEAVYLASVLSPGPLGPFVLAPGE